MPAKSSRLPAAALAPGRGALLAPAILLLGATLAVGQSTRRRPCSWLSASHPQPRADAPAASALLRAAGAQPSGAFTPAQRKEIEAIIKDILVNNPEVLLEAQNALEAKMDKIQADQAWRWPSRRTPASSSARPPRRWSATPRATCR